MILLFRGWHGIEGCEMGIVERVSADGSLNRRSGDGNGLSFV
jgi:hypothetical protein